jgi:hypothetical protein
MYLDLMSHCNGDSKDDLHASIFLLIFYFNSNFFSHIINNLSDGLVEPDNLFPNLQVLALIFLYNLQDLISHSLDNGMAATFDLESINVIINLLTIKFDKLHTRVIIKQLQHTKVITRYAL